MISANLEVIRKMSVHTLIRPFAQGLEGTLARLALGIRGDRPGLLSFVFHALFEDRKEAVSGHLDPFQPITINDFRAFWWDVLYRRRRQNGLSLRAIRREREALKKLPNSAIEAHLQASFGRDYFCPESDLDRPMTERELRVFAANARVSIGNHTADHAILTVYDNKEVKSQIESCQSYLAKVTGTAPAIIAYPNGNHDRRIVEVARAAGLQLGVVTDPRRTSLPLADGTRMTIGRFNLYGGRNLANQCRSCQSGTQLLPALRRLSAKQAPDSG